MHINTIFRMFSVLIVIAFLATPAGPAHAISNGTISGALKDADDNPITGVEIQVRVVLKSDGSEAATSTSNPADGTYVLSGLPLDTDLAVVASDEDPDTDGYAGEYYNNTGGLDWAETIILTSGNENRGGVDFKLTDGSWDAIEHLTFNTVEGRLLNDVELRRAIAYGTNRQALLNDAFAANGSTGDLVYMMVSPLAWFLADPAEVTVYNFDQTVAETILTNAGWIDTDADDIRENSGEELELDFVTTTQPARAASANLFKAQMAEIGIRVNVFTHMNLNEVWEFRDFDIVEFAWTSTADFDDLIGVYNTDDPNNVGGFSSAALDGYFNATRESKAAGDLSGFEANALLWQQTFADQLPSFPMFTRSGLRNLPSFSVRANSDEVEGWEWVDGSTVTIEVDEDGDSNPEISHTADVGTAPWDENQTWFMYNFSGEFDIQPGHIVTVSDGIVTKTHTVTNITITEIDQDTEIVHGSADPSANVDVWTCDDIQCYNRHVTADAVSGEWQADFANPGMQDDEQDTVDFGPNSWADCGQPDEDGDSTQFWAQVPNPTFGVRANWDGVEGWNWVDGSTVTIEIDNNGDGLAEISRNASVGPASWNPDELRFDYNFSGEFDIQPGDEITVSDGETTKSLVVSIHSITSYDLDTDVVYGTSDPDTRVDVWACDEYGCYNRHLTTDPVSGDWAADFATPGTEDDEQDIVDLVPGIWIDSSQPDEDWDQTLYGLNVLNPFVEASRQNNWVHAREWPNGTLMTLEIDDLSNGLGGIDYTRTAEMGPAPWNPGDPNDIVADFDMSGFTLEAGDVIKISGEIDEETVTKNLTLSALEVTGFDMDADTVSGSATPDLDVEVCVNIPNTCISRHATADSADGTWTVGYHPDHDLVLGDNGWAAEFDEDNDRTWYDWYVPRPHMDVWLEHDYVDTYEWALGEELTLEIENPATVLSPDYTTTMTVETAPWDPNQTWAGFDLNGLFDLTPGMFVTVSGDTITKQLTISNLSITKIDQFNETVSGMTDPNQAMWMWYEDSCCRSFQADGSGAWSVDFKAPGSDGEPIADIYPGANGAVNASDDDGDNTSLGWLAPELLEITSSAAEDGWILEKSETAGKGGKMKNDTTVLNIGDDKANKQYRAILSFDTSALPENAEIVSVTLQFKYAGVKGTLPFKTHGNLLADIRMGDFSDNAPLELKDFKAPPTELGTLSFNKIEVAGWYIRSLSAADFGYITLDGNTQFRLRFKKDDNNDFGADFLKIYSGDAAEADRPLLVIEYYVP
jgi:hypothetical protein